jgi:hypothetical protein
MTEVIVENEILKNQVLKSYKTATRYPVCANCMNITYETFLLFKRCKLSGAVVQDLGQCDYYEGVNNG